MNRRDVISLNPIDKQSFLDGLDKETKNYEKAKKKDDPAQYFTMIKQLTILEYFSSNEGATEALKYVAIPGRYDGVKDYKEVAKA